MQTEAQHTPGPWTVRDYKTADGGLWIDGGFRRKRSCGTVALVYPVTAQAADARLIAAAPDLLAVLLRIEGCMDFDASDHPLFAGLQGQMQDAIRKATAA